MPRRFFTPSPTPRPRPNPLIFAKELKEEEPEVIMFVDDDDEEGEALKELGFPVGMHTDSEREDDGGFNLTVHDISNEMDGKMDGTRLSLDGRQSLPLDDGKDAMHLDEEDMGPDMDMTHCQPMEQEVCVVTIFSGGMLFGETIMEQM